jgi:hypothetical protein
MQCIITTANELLREGRSGGSTSEIIAAAFILNDMDKLLADYHIVAHALDR